MHGFFLILLILLPLSASAGELTPSAPPDDPAGHMISLRELNDYLVSGTAPAAPSAVQGPSGPPGATMVSLQQVYDAFKALMDRSDVTAADVRAGKKYFSTAPWGIQDGTLPDRTLSATSADLPAGYYDATTLNAVDADLRARNIIEGVTIFGVEGSLPRPGEGCGAWVTSKVWKEFDCYNLGARGRDDGDFPFIPSWKLNGGYWQWGRKGPDSEDWYDTNTPYFAHGPTGPDADEANDGAIGSWNTTDYPPDDAWSDDEKTANDPCPDGFRLPSRSQWSGVRLRNTERGVGTWGDDATNYSSAKFYGYALMLPAAGRRSRSDGSLIERGYYGRYWAADGTGFGGMCNSEFAPSTRGENCSRNLDGMSLRCIAE